MEFINSNNIRHWFFASTLIQKLFHTVALQLAICVRKTKLFQYLLFVVAVVIQVIHIFQKIQDNVADIYVIGTSFYTSDDVTQK